MKKINDIKPNFKTLMFLNIQTLTNFPYIEDDFDALTNYELLCKIVEELNILSANQKTTNDNVIALSNAFNELKDYIDNYFENLDVQEEINNKLDEMVEDGTLQEIIVEYLQISGLLSYDTVADMKAATNLINGSKCKTMGFYSINDGGSATYRVRLVTNLDDVNEKDIIALSDESLIAELIVDEEYINPKKYGAKLDGTTDDTEVIEYCLSKGNVLLPNKSSVKINNLTMVEYRTLDFNGSEVYCTNTAITCGSKTANSYTRNFIIKNGNFTNSETSETNNDIKIIQLFQCIRSVLENINISHVENGNVGIWIENCFNITVNNFYLGNGNSAKSSNSSGIIVIADTPSITGTNNLTNIKIENGLIQNVNAGFNSKISNGSIDTLEIENIGLSNCGNGFVFEGNSNTSKNVKLISCRVEGTDIGVYNFGQLTISNLHIAFLDKTTAIGIYNRNTGRIICNGYLGLIGTSTGMIIQGFADFSNCFPALNTATTPLNLQVPIIRPLIVENTTHSGTDFSNYVHPFYDYQFVQTDAFNKNDLPSGCQNGTKLTILYNDKPYICVYQNNTWYMS